MIFVDIFGTIDAPSKNTGYSLLYGSSGLGLVDLVNNLLGLITAVAGIFVIVNFISAGYLYLSSNGEPQKVTAAGNKILQTVIGIGIVALAYIIAAIAGKILFDDPKILLEPKIFAL